MRATALLALLALGCGSTIILAPPSGNDSGVAPTEEGTLVTDAAVTADASATTDAAVGSDTPAVADAGVTPLNGRWRLTRFDYLAPDGTPRSVTDVDTQVPDATGAMTTARANGALYVADDRLAATVGTLISDHFYTDDMGYSANGFGAAGLLDQASGRFALTGSATMGLTLERNADGTVSISGDSFGTNRVTFARASVAAAVNQISAAGLAMIRETMPSGVPTANLRVALFWDQVGTASFTETNGVAVHFIGRFASYPVVLAGPPPLAVRGRVGVATVALARVALYVDQDGSMTFDRTVDRGVAISPVGIAWRDDTAATDATNTPVRDLQAGYQYVHVHVDTSLGRAAVTPFDTNNLVSPDLPLSLAVSASQMAEDVL